MDETFDRPHEFLSASVDVTVVDFSFQYTEEVFHGCVVVAVAFSRHALKDVMFFQHGLIGGHLVAPPAIGVKGAAIGAGIGAFDSFFQALQHGDPVGLIGEDIADDFQIVHVHVRIEVEFLCLKFPRLIFFVVFEFCGVGGYFWVGDGGIEAAVDSIFLDSTDDTFVGVVLLVFPAIGADLKAHSLNQSLNFLFIHGPTSILQLQVDPSVAVVFVFMPNGENSSFKAWSLSFSLHFFCQYIKVDFGKLMAARISLSWNCSRSLATILAFCSLFLPFPNSLTVPRTSFEW